MDGSPSRGETIPIRLFLGGFDLTPTFREVNKKFSTRYYLSLVLIDEGLFSPLPSPLFFFALPLSKANAPLRRSPLFQTIRNSPIPPATRSTSSGASSGGPARIPAADNSAPSSASAGKAAAYESGDGCTGGAGSE